MKSEIIRIINEILECPPKDKAQELRFKLIEEMKATTFTEVPKELELAARSVVLEAVQRFCYVPNEKNRKLVQRIIDKDLDTYIREYRFDK